MTAAPSYKTVLEPGLDLALLTARGRNQGTGYGVGGREYRREDASNYQLLRAILPFLVLFGERGETACGV